MLKFLLFFIIGLLLYPVFCFIFVFFKVFFGTNAILKKLQDSVTILACDYKVFMLRKKYAEENSINYTTPFEFKYVDNNMNIQTESMSQIEFLNKLGNLENDVDNIIENMDDKLKTTEPALSSISYFHSLKQKIREANPYAY